MFFLLFSSFIDYKASLWGNLLNG